MPIVETVGKDQYLRMIVIWGYGPLRITDIRIGDTPINDFANARIETLEGRASDSSLTLYPSNIDKQDLSVTLTKNAGWQERRSAINATELSVSMVLPKGIAKFDDEGKHIKNIAEIQLQYKLMGTSAWKSILAVSTDDTFTNSWITDRSTGKIQLEGASNQPITHGIRWSVTKGQYDIRIRRLSADEVGIKKFSTIIWSTLFTITNASVINFPKALAMSAISIRITDQLSDTIDQLNGLAESEALDWNGNAWVPAYTRNPASLYRLVLQHPARQVIDRDSNIDLVNLKEFHEFCVVNNYMFDLILDTRQSIWDALSDICAVGRASPNKIGNKFSVVVDTGTQAVAQHFTPINSSGFRFTRSFAPVLDGLKCVFVNKDKNYRRDERMMYSKGKNDINAIRIQEIRLVGITDKDHVYKFGKFHLAQALLRREIWNLAVNFEYLTANKSSKITIQHDALVVGIASARVIGIITDLSNNITGIKIDTSIYLPENVVYGVKLRTFNNANIVSAINEQEGEYDIFTFTQAISQVIEIGTLISVGEFGAETLDGIITSVDSRDELTATLSIMPYKSEIYDAETGVIPAFVSSIIDEEKRAPNLTILSIHSDEGAVRIIGDVYEPGIYVSVSPIPNITAFIEAEIRNSSTGEPYNKALIRNKSTDSIEIGSVEINNSYDVRLRWNIPGILPGKWTERLTQLIKGNTPPDSPSAFPSASFTLVEGLGKLRSFSWNFPSIPNLAGFRIKLSNNSADTWDNMGYLGVGIITSSPYETSQPKGAGTYTFEIRTVDTAGKVSLSGSRLTITLSAVEEALDGTQWHSGPGVPSSTLGENGDFYIRTTTNEVYEKKTGTWAIISNLSGADGAIWFSGTALPASSIGTIGDYYFRITNAGIYKKTTNTTWTFQIDIDGEDGATWHTGSGVPNSALGVIGDFYFRQSNGYVYEKTLATTWAYRADITGPQGASGINGSIWYSGSEVPSSTLGVTGDFYIRTNNVVYKKRNSSSWTIISDLSGADGATWFSGSGLPSSGLGKSGDYYFRTTGARIYKKTTSWIFQLTIAGRNGSNGSNGSNGRAGSNGSNGRAGDDGSVWHTGSGVPSSVLGSIGDYYFRQSNGWVYEKTGSRTWGYRADITGPMGLRGPAGTIPGASSRTNTISETTYRIFYISPVAVTSSTYALISFTYTQTGASSTAVGSCVIPYATSGTPARVAISSEGGGTTRSDPIFLYAYWRGRNLYIARSSGVTMGNTAFKSAAIIQVTT